MQRLIHKRVTIQRQIQRLPHPHVLEGRECHIHAVKINSKVGKDPQHFGEILLVKRNAIQAQRFRHVKSAIAEESLLCGHIRHHHKPHAVEFDVFRIPIIGIAFGLDVILEFPLLELEGAVAHHVAGSRPLIEATLQSAIFLDDLSGNRKPGEMQQHREEIGNRSIQRQLQRVVIQGLGPYFAEVLGFPFVESLGVLQFVEHIRITCAEGG